MSISAQCLSVSPATMPEVLALANDSLPGLALPYSINSLTVLAGTLRALAVTRLKRSALIPQLPTLDEAGVKGFDMDSWAGIFAPVNTPPEIITLLNKELRKIIDSPEVKGQLGNLGFEAFSSSPDELGGFIKSQLGHWARMVKDAGIQPE